jgi:glycosyltransferase involved in cell wall biosynthesis
MNCLNGDRYLREAIDSVCAQTYPHWEIVFWDNASTDGSAAIAQGYDTRLRYFRGEETVPLGGARNLAMAQARGEFIAFLDCDDVWLPEKLEKQVPLFADPEVGLVYCDCLNFDNNGVTQRFYSTRKFYTGYCFRQLLMDNFLSLGTVVIRRSALDEEPGWFDPHFNLVEDGDFFTRLGYKWQLAMVPEPLAKWRVHAASWTWQKNYLSAVETDAMLAKYHRLIPDFARQFSVEIRIVETQIAVSRAKNLWKSGQGASARHGLKPYVWQSRKALLLYLASFFPEKSLYPLLCRFRQEVILPAGPWGGTG